MSMRCAVGATIMTGLVGLTSLAFLAAVSAIVWGFLSLMFWLHPLCGLAIPVVGLLICICVPCFKVWFEFYDKCKAAKEPK